MQIAAVHVAITGARSETVYYVDEDAVSGLTMAIEKQSLGLVKVVRVERHSLAHVPPGAQLAPLGCA